MSSLIDQFVRHQDKIAFWEGNQSFSYSALFAQVTKVSAWLLEDCEDLKGKRVGLMANPGIDYLSGLFGIWQAGGVAVPICLTYPAEQINYYASDAGLSGICCSPEYIDAIRPIADQLNFKIGSIKLMHQSFDIINLPIVDADREAMILYTSGTTNKPKGVVITHHTISAQISTLVDAWAWNKEDQIISFLPLHHIHGIINVVCCALWSGATLHFIPSFDAREVSRLILQQPINLFMAVPTIYFKFIQYLASLDPVSKTNLLQKLNGFRLMVSGSAALPVRVLEDWKQLTGHILLERYGMTEIGMAISNPLQGARKPGSIGMPLPGVGVRLVDDEGNAVPEGHMGEIQIKGQNVFQGYWQRPDATRQAFTEDGWFKSGDIAIVEHGYYRIMGRNSVDIIKSGGYKISALEIEEILRTYPGIKDCAIIGLPNEEWGETVAAAIMTGEKNELDIPALKQWLQNKLPSYRMPRTYIQLAELPRNSMGKVVKGEVKKMFEQ
ncbi:MAG: acyl-CoA synthetase [Saprospiraceae bacterium]|nr:acyl-CoA synthetase [Saprospiraceae bacterium]